MRKFFGSLVALFSFFLFTTHASAHEAYVLTQNEFQQGLATFSQNPLIPLLDPHFLGTTLCITFCVILLYVLSFLLATTSFASFFDRIIRKAAGIGPLVVRLAISSSFFYAAQSNSILGPELSLHMVPGGEVIRFFLFLLSLMIFFGFLTELAAVIGLLLFFYVTNTFHAYMITYANYFGEMIVLFLFGSRFLSLDGVLFGKKAWIGFFEKKRFLEIPIVRILYGVALMYAGWTIKFAHQSLSVEVYNQYHLINFFHAPAQFIAAGAGVSEILIGFFIVLGFAQRLTTLISLVFITLSILYFKELLWPHFMLYGISFSLIINSSDIYTIDRYFVPCIRKRLHQFFKKKK